MNDTVKLNQCPKCGSRIPADAPQGLCPQCVLLGVATHSLAECANASLSELPALERVAAAFPQLEILELVGRGGMGFVYKARQQRLDRLVALKLLPDKLARDARFAERFNREGRVLARLHHPNIVTIYDFGQTPEFFFLLMEYVDGVNLREAMQAGRFSPSEALAIVPEICGALQYAHSQGILHRDIKPANILLDARGRVKIADFGIAKLIGEEKADVTLTATGASLGTPHYMAPEQLEKPGEVDHRADIYSLGVVFYEMLTGELPIGRFAPPSTKTPVSTNVDEVVFRTLEKDRERRFQSAGEMKTQIEHLGVGNSTTPPSASAARVSSRAVLAALLVGLSFPVPMLVAFAAISGKGGIGPGELWLGFGSVALAGLGGTILGWLSLHEIRQSEERLRGLPFAIAATMTWPMLLLAAFALALPMLGLNRVGSSGILGGIGQVLALLVPAGILTFGCWAVYTTVRWANRLPTAPHRGVLKWVFLALLLAGAGRILVNRPWLFANGNQPSLMPAGSQFRESDAPERHGEILAARWLKSPVPAVATNFIRFTFTTVDILNEGSTQWFAFAYAADVKGDCEETFRVAGPVVLTRKTGLLVTPPGTSPIRHQRFQCRVPPGTTPATLAKLREDFENTLIAKSFVIPAGEERALFRLPVGLTDELSVEIGAALRSELP